MRCPWKSGENGVLRRKEWSTMSNGANKWSKTRTENRPLDLARWRSMARAGINMCYFKKSVITLPHFTVK